MSSLPMRGSRRSHFLLIASSSTFLAPAPALWLAIPEIKWRLRTEDLLDLQSRQVAILKSALAQLAKGGRLVYSTCSLEREENESVLEAALGGTAEFRIADCRQELDRLRQSGELALELGERDIASLVAGPYLRTIPGVHPCDGFFAALIERK